MSRASKRVVGLLVIAVIGVSVASVLTQGVEPTVVYTTPVERVSELKAVVRASGEIQPRDSVDIQAEIAGVIIELPVKEGDTVERGQVLLKIDPIATAAETAAVRAALEQATAEQKGQEVQIAMAEAGLLSDESQLKSAELEKVQADANWKRAEDAYVRRQKLVEQQLISTEDLEVAKNTFDVAAAARDAAAARVAQFEALLRANRIAMDQVRALRDAAGNRVQAARANLDRAEDMLKKTTIYSPLTGVITKLNVEVGERAVPGILSNPQATLMTIADMTVIDAEIEVDETDVVQIRLGDLAEIEVDALPDRVLVGEVAEIGNSPIDALGSGGNQSADVKDFLVKVRLRDVVPELRPGLSCSADITTEVRSDVLVIPIQSFTARDFPLDEAGEVQVPTPEQVDAQAAAEAAAAEAGTPIAAPVRQLTETTPGVFVRGPGDRAVFRPVTIGIAGQLEYEVLSGLEGGEEVVSGPYKVLRTLEVGDAISVDNSRSFRSTSDKGGTN